MTTIQWTDETWNPTVGCSRVSDGCERCYAERVASREMQPAHKGLTRSTSRGPTWTGEVRMMPERLAIPLRWRKPRRVFVDSMSDLFHESVPDEFISAVFGSMAICHQHTFQVLTKRPDRMVRWFRDEPERGHLPTALAEFYIAHPAAAEIAPLDAKRAIDAAERGWPLPNVWLGVSVENARTTDRIDQLRRVPAAVRFLSLEPLLGPLDELDLGGIHWIIVGGESGPGARPCDVEWIRSVVRQGREAGVPVFVKQLGARPVGEFGVQDDGWSDHVKVVSRGDGLGDVRLSDRKGGDPSEWPEDLRVREFHGA